MPILRRIPDETPREQNVLELHHVPGHESGRVLHGGTCPLRGLVQPGGRRGPGCTAACVGPTPPVLVESVFAGLVLEADEEQRTATVWNFLHRCPETLTFGEDPVFVSRATVDATPGIRRLYEDWCTWRDIEALIRAEKEEKRKAAIRATIREIEDRRAEAARRAREEELAARQAQLLRIRSTIKPGSRLRVVADPPGFAEKMRRLKPRYRTPSAVGLTGTCVDPGLGPYVFVRIDGSTTRRLLRSQVRVVFPDGSLGVEDPREY